MYNQSIGCSDWSVELLYDIYVVMHKHLLLYPVNVCSHATPITKQIATN